MREIYKEFERNNTATTNTTIKINALIEYCCGVCYSDTLNSIIKKYLCQLIELNAERQLYLLKFLTKIEKSENLGGTKK